MQRRILLSLLCALVAFTSAPARGQITGTTGGVVFVSNPPASVSENVWESDTDIRIFAERQSFTLSQDLTADITLAGTYSGNGNSTLTPGVIPAGTVVNVFTLHYDVLGSRSTFDPLEALGSVTFGSNILGLLAINPSENSTNALFGLPGEVYSSDSFHGLELAPTTDPTSDLVTLSPDLRTITLDLHSAGFADDLRVLTSVPEPATMSWLSVAVSVALLGRRRRDRVTSLRS